MTLTPTDPYNWVRMIRRLRLGSPATKLVALTLADYASANGEDIWPGNDRLALVCEITEKSVRRALKTLRDLGFIERLTEGSRSGRRALASIYRLTFPDPSRLPLDMLGPDEKPVDNPLPLELMSSDPAPVTADPVRPEDRSPDMSSRSPDMSDRITGTHVPPPKQVPNQPPTKIQGLAKDDASVEGSGGSSGPVENRIIAHSVAEHSGESPPLLTAAGGPRSRPRVRCTGRSPANPARRPRSLKDPHLSRKAA